MKRILLIALIFALPNCSYAQEEIITDREIPALNKIIDSLENDLGKKELPQYLSLPQTTGHFFTLETQFPQTFIEAFKNGESLEVLAAGFPNMQIDRDLLIIKNSYITGAGEQKMEVKSFEINNNDAHRITLEASDSLTNPELKLFYVTNPVYNSDDTRISGFSLHENFQQHVLPQQYGRWIFYTDQLVQPGTDLFYNNSSSPSFYQEREKTPVDSLVNYYARVSQKPGYDRPLDPIEYRKLITDWEGKRAAFADSLFTNDPDFKNLLFEALDYAESNEQSNGELEFFVAQLISAERALELIRFNRQRGTCSFDNGPVEQQKRMAKLAAKVPEWNIFIKSFLNVMNDRVSRVANSNIASEARKTYIQELTKLDLDVNTLLLGSNLRLAASDHYFSDGGKVGKAFSQLPDADKDLFEQAVEVLISNEAVDAFNKLHFYNTLSHYHYHLGKSARKEKVAGKLEQMAAFMPFPISSRLEDPHKELKDLLFREKHLLDQFHILRSSIGHIYSYRYSGNCWIAKIREKYGNPQLVYSLTMPVKDSITPLSGFLKQKPMLTKRIEDHAFLQKLLKADPGNKLILRFTEDRSFSNYKNKVLKELPEAVKENRSFENAISFSISYPDGNYVKYLLFENNDLLLFEIPMDFSLPGYTFRELVTNTKESLFSVSYESYKIFNEQGEILN